MQKLICGTNVSLSDFDKLTKPQIPNATFSHFEFVNIQKYINNPSHEDLQQDGVRDGNNNELEIDDLVAGLTQDGFKTTYFPPVFTQNYKRRNGTRRISSFVELNEKFIPAAIYVFDDEDSRISKIVSGSILNEQKDSSKPNNFQNYKTQLSALVKEKAFDKSNREEVRTYIRKVLNLKHKSSRTINDLVEYVYNLREDGIRLIREMNYGEVMKYLNSSYDLTNKYGIEKGQINKDTSKPEVVATTPSEDAIGRVIINHILPNAIIGRKTIIVPYTTKLNPEVERQRIKSFKPRLDTAVELMGQFVSNELEGISITQPFISKAYDVEITVPQLETPEHRALFRYNKLIDIEKY